MTTQYIYDLVDTWNDGATTFTAVKMNVTDTASNAASLLMDLQVGGSSRFRVKKDGGIVSPGYADSSFVNGDILISGASTLWVGYGVKTGGAGYFGLSSTAASNSTPDTWITRRNIANLRFGAADAATAQPQILSVQSVVAGTSNTAGANLTITGSQGTGTGAGGSIIFQVAPAGSTGTAQNALVSAWSISGSGHFLAGTDNAYDIGAAGATRPRNLYLGGNITSSGGITIAAAGYFVWPARASLDAVAADIVRLNGSSAGGALQLTEMTAPASPATNNVRIYAEDNGSGKTRIMALFPTGAAVQIAIEP